MQGAVRWARVLVLAGWAVALGVLAHALGGGEPPPASLTVLMVGIVGLLLAPALEREQTLAALVGWTVLAQLGVHLALLQHGPSAGHGGVALLGHLLAAALLAGWLRGGEAAVWRLLRRLLPPLPRITGPGPVPVGRSAPGGREPAPPVDRLLPGAAGRRAPPRCGHACPTA